MVDPNDFNITGSQAKLESDIEMPTVLQMDEEITLEDAKRLLDQNKRLIFGRTGFRKPEAVDIIRTTDPTLKYQLYFVVEARYEIEFLQSKDYRIRTSPGVISSKILDHVVQPAWNPKLERHEGQKKGRGIITLAAVNRLLFFFEDTIVTNWRGKQVSMPKFSFSEIIRKRHELQDFMVLEKKRKQLLNPQFTSEKPIIDQIQREFLRKKPREIDRILRELMKITTTIVLYPVWEAEYLYKNRERKVYVDGLTGAVVRKV